ncbi:hypothetical protein Esti_004429 [Eimeria stiedai]
MSGFLQAPAEEHKRALEGESSRCEWVFWQFYLQQHFYRNGVKCQIMARFMALSPFYESEEVNMWELFGVKYLGQVFSEEAAAFVARRVRLTSLRMRHFDSDRLFRNMSYWQFVLQTAAALAEGLPKLFED